MGILIRRLWISLTLLLAVLLLALPVPAAGPRDQARALADRGYELFQERQYAEANAHFREAEHLFHAPTLVLMIARTYEKLGRIADAERAYLRVTQEELPSDAPQEFQDARAAAVRELAILTPRVPHVVFRFPAGGHERVAVTIDGDPVPAEALQQPVAVAPGAHAVVVRRPGDRALERQIQLVEGQRATILVEVVPGASDEPLGPEPGLSTLQVAGIVGIVVGGVGLAGGIVAGAVAIDHQSQLEEACPTRTCDQEDESLLNNGETAATASTVAFIAGGAIAALGVTLLVVDATRELNMAIEVTPTGLLLRGTF